jgi:hypothetical protein
MKSSPSSKIFASSLIIDYYVLFGIVTANPSKLILAVTFLGGYQPLPSSFEPETLSR